MTLVDKCIGELVWVIMKDNREITGTLQGYDNFLSTLSLLPQTWCLKMWRNTKQRAREAGSSPNAPPFSSMVLTSQWQVHFFILDSALLRAWIQVILI